MPSQPNETIREDLLNALTMIRLLLIPIVPADLESDCPDVLAGIWTRCMGHPLHTEYARTFPPLHELYRDAHAPNEDRPVAGQPLDFAVPDEREEL